MTSRRIVRFAAACLLASVVAAGASTAIAATVPDVGGMTYDRAAEALEEAGLSGETYRANGSPIAVLIGTNWQVSVQDPAAGTEVEEGSAVSVNLVRLSGSEARHALELKLQRDAERGIDVLTQWASDVVVFGEPLPAGSYDAVVATPDGDVPVTIVVEDGNVAMVAFGVAEGASSEAGSSGQADTGGSSIASIISAVVAAGSGE